MGGSEKLVSFVTNTAAATPFNAEISNSGSLRSQRGLSSMPWWEPANCKWPLSLYRSDHSPHSARNRPGSAISYFLAWGRGLPTSLFLKLITSPPKVKSFTHSPCSLRTNAWQLSSKTRRLLLPECAVAGQQRTGRPAEGLVKTGALSSLFSQLPRTAPRVLVQMPICAAPEEWDGEDFGTPQSQAESSARN